MGRRRPGPGWTRLSRRRSTTAIHYHHDASGWAVKHCGHPTANWPYYLVDPDHPGTATVAFNGLGFATLAAACGVVEGIVAGHYMSTAGRCTPGTRRVPEVTAAGEPTLEVVQSASIVTGLEVWTAENPMPRREEYVFEHEWREDLHKWKRALHEETDRLHIGRHERPNT